LRRTRFYSFIQQSDSFLTVILGCFFLLFRTKHPSFFKHSVFLP